MQVHRTFWWREEGSRWEMTTTTTRSTIIHFTIMLIKNHNLNNTIASRMLILVRLDFSMIEIRHLCVEIHLHDPWKTRGRGRKDVNNSSTQNASETAIEISPYDLTPFTRTWYWHKQPSHKINLLMISAHSFDVRLIKIGLRTDSWYQIGT